MNLENTPTRPVRAISCYIAYISSLVIGFLSSQYLLPSYAEQPILLGLIITCISTAVIFVFSIANNNSSIYDPYWVIAPPFLVLLLKYCSDGHLFTDWDTRRLLILGVFVIWAARYHIFYAWSGWRTGLTHEDWRYEEMRKAPLPYWFNSLLGMHYFPTFLVYIAFIPAALVLSQPSTNTPLQFYDILGVSLALTAVLIQFLSDRQLKTYRTTEAYREGSSCRVGLWKFSRHPNYFGEVLFWLSFIPVAIGADLFKGNEWLVLTGPIVMAIFFRFSSYLMDMRSLKRRHDYNEVMKETSAMIPLP